jgi:methylglutamate dehydrogenase subunit B
VARVPRLTGTEVKITCPFCGPRTLVEYSYAGSAEVARPVPDAPMVEWNAFLHLRVNAYGMTQEYWQHVAGCRAVLVVTRDTRSHAIASVRMAGA